MTVKQTAKDSTKNLVNSALEVNKIAIAEIEKLCALQRDSLAYYQELGVKQLQTIAEVQGVDDVKKIFSHSIATSGDIAKRVLEDLKNVVSRGNEFKSAVTDTVKSSLRKTA